MKKKLFAIFLCIAMLAIAVVGGSLAYFTDTQAKTNTFTMGKVGITLTEPEWDKLEKNKDGVMKVYPGQSYDKDPTITVDADSENCWLIATVTINNKANLERLFKGTNVATQWGLSLAGEGKLVSGGVASYVAAPDTKNSTSGTTLSKDDKEVAFITYEEKNDTIIYTYYFLEAHSAGAEEILFKKVNIPATIDNNFFNENADNASTDLLSITVNAYAIQEKGFDDVFAAYTAYKTQES